MKDTKKQHKNDYQSNNAYIEEESVEEDELQYFPPQVVNAARKKVQRIPNTMSIASEQQCQQSHSYYQTGGQGLGAP